MGSRDAAIGERLRWLRLMAGNPDQASWAKRLGVHRSQISRWEHAVHTPPQGADYLETVAELIDVPKRELRAFVFDGVPLTTLPAPLRPFIREPSAAATLRRLADRLDDTGGRDGRR